MYRIPFAIKAVYRWLLFNLRRSELVHNKYEAPDVVPTHLGWYELNGDVLVFVRTDRSLQFYW
jgi:hypothetical protein